jgi:hypothetical protein
MKIFDYDKFNLFVEKNKNEKKTTTCAMLQYLYNVERKASTLCRISRERERERKRGCELCNINMLSRLFNSFEHFTKR